MIRKMKKITVLALSRDLEKLVLSMRDLGVVHISDMVTRCEKSEEKEKRKAVVARVIANAESFVDKKNKVEGVALEGEELDRVVDSITSLMAEEAALSERIRVLSAERDRIALWGDFDPKDIRDLEKEGISIHLYQVEKKTLKALNQDESVTYIPLKCESGLAVAVIGDELSKDYALSPFVIPERSLGEIESELIVKKKRLEEILSIYKDSVRYIDSLKAWCTREDENILFEKVEATCRDEGELVSISGYIPENQADAFRAYAKENSLAYLMDDPSEDENPPTELVHKGFVRIIKPLFDMLGLVPGYREMDISSYFLVFMALFFAMIIGDAGYGLLLVGVAAALNIKMKKCNDLVALIYVMSGATVIWGAITGTWFGSETLISKVPLLRLFVVPGLTNFPSLFMMDSLDVQNNMMTLCFSIGTIHLSLGCVLSILDKLKKKDLSFLADLGWLMNTNLLFLLVLFLVVHTPVPFTIIVVGIVIGFLLVCCFGEMAPDKSFSQGLKESLGGFFTTFIDTISCFSNVMSYIRLFAVGLASLAIAQSFNGMAAGMLSGLALPAGILVLVIGHAVNLVMGFLSIIVHGVRLNIMEFSGQVGVEWSGYKYEPFRKRVID